MTTSTITRIPDLATSLGVASAILGLSELLAPRGVARLAGVVDGDGSRRAIQLLGARECGHAAAILLVSRQLVWTRVVGDVLDVGLLVKALTSPGANRRRGAAAMGFLSLIGAADAWATRRQLRQG
ncbi:malate dehydrogenase [Mycobacterium yunnanensis]|uniref:Malate dehydrogenase n=1 Tax=Mycobacterium yunnanensis TaxID=368477 RepID=A0A9X3BST1_9MYCO|nr:malate dehydrogenase [Mycobacterium yunnanensis]MCV7420395.1 malate dehydrogenase [Mycobacterium yunnanensis]